MHHLTKRPNRSAGRYNIANWMASLAAALLLSACGGGASTTETGAATTASCDPNNSATASECGTLLLALTDADGDFLNYTVDISSLTLETANGRIVETLPRKTRINFTDYVEISELVAAANIPPAVYVSGSITLDYSDAEVFVEADGEAKAAVVTSMDGTPLTQSTLKITLSNRDQLKINKGRAALLQLDFDLDASHVVDIVATPALAASEQFIVAEVTPVDEKTIRVRGPLLAVDEGSSSYTVAIRPFHDRDGDFGRMQVNVTDVTEIEIDGDWYAGPEGLRALAAAGPGTPTVAKGTLTPSDRSFTATSVLAGSSVPGAERDTVVGNIIARDGNFLTVRGATIIPTDRRAHFHDDVIVEVGADTKISKQGMRAMDLTIDALSIGQRVSIRGNQASASTDANAPQVLFDATQGHVRMHVTNLLGVVNTVMPGQTDITLHAIDRRRAAVFDFSGTGAASETDADPDNYEIGTGNLGMPNFAAGKPIIAKGFPAAFGTAPFDFTGRTVIDYTEVRSSLGIGWGLDGSSAPFGSIGADGLLIDNQNADIGERHFIKQGPLLIDLTSLDSNTLIVPRSVGRSLFYIKSNDSLRLYSDFDDFVADLSVSLDGATTARSMHVRGKYDRDSNVFAAAKIGIYLLEP